MTVTLDLPDDIAQMLGSPEDVSRRALESFGLEEFRAGRLTQPELRRLLNLSRYELDGFLKAHGEFIQYSMEDFDREWEALRKTGF
jgi:hypothetical protein